MTPCSWSRPRRLRRRARARRPLSVCEACCAGRAFRADRRLLRFPVLCRAEAEDCGAWVRKSWHRTAPTSSPFLLYWDKCFRATWSVRGARARDCDSFRAIAVWSSLFDSERARPAPRPCGDGSVAGGVSCDLWPSFRATGNDCGLSMCHWDGHVIDPTPVLRVPKAKNVRTDCQCAVRLVRLELTTRTTLHVAAAMGKDRKELGRTSTARFVQPHNVITLSCKNRPPCRPPRAARRLPRLTMQWRERTAARVAPRRGFGPPKRGPAHRPV